MRSRMAARRKLKLILFISIQPWVLSFLTSSCVLLSYSIFVGVEKSGKNAEGDSWWETWQEVLHQDEWRSMGFFLMFH